MLSNSFSAANTENPFARHLGQAGHEPAQSAQAFRGPAGVEVSWARHLEEVREAQKLRFDVFSLEMGARLHTSVPGHDVDLFDNYCEHLLVRASDTGQVIGTYRVLTPIQAQRVGSTYSDTEFDLTRLRTIRDNMVELGRSCVHPAHRHGGVILALWGALTGFMVRNQLDTMIGCASIPLLHEGRVDGNIAASVWHQVRQKHLASVQYQVLPRKPFPMDRLNHELPVSPPALVQAYLRLGAKVMGPPAWDADFQCADLPLMMRLQDLPARYRRHFLGLS